MASPDNPERDFVDKRRDYAEASIPEYWIVDPATETINMLRLNAQGYVEHGQCGRGEQAESVEFEGFAVDVGSVFDAGQGEREEA